MEEFLWVERYRPKNIDECILPDRIKAQFKNYAETKVVPNLILSGKAGGGKTTIAKALLEETGMSYMFINASKDNGVDEVRNRIVTYATSVSFDGGRKVIILDEADGLSNQAQDAFKATIEECSNNCTFIFTCNKLNKIIDPIKSRCALVDFTLKSEEKPKMAVKFMKRIEEILTTENVVYEKSVLVKVIEKYFPDFRRTIGQLQAFAAEGPIDARVITQLADIKNFSDLTNAFKTNNWSSMRKWVTANSDVDAQVMMRRVYDNMADIFTSDSIPKATLIVADYMYKHYFVQDAEVNLVACFTELMLECEVKQ